MASDLEGLIAKVEAATSADFGDINYALWDLFDRKWLPNGGRGAVVPERCESIDAALALKDRLLPGQAAAMGDMAFTAHPKGPWATVWSLQGEPKWSAEAATPALAIILATLRAKAATP